MIKQIEGTTIDVEADNVSELENDNDADLSSIFAEFGGAPDDKAYKMKVYRILPDRAEMAWLFDCVPSELPMHNRLRDQYKGGRFEVRIYELKSGVFKLRKKPHLLIEAPQISETTQSTDLATIVRAMHEQQQQMFTQLTTVIKQGSGAPDLPQNPLSLLKDLAQTMRDIMPAPPQQTSMREMVETMAMFKELIPESGGGGNTNWMDVLTKAMDSPLLGNMLEGAANAAKAQPRIAAPAEQSPQQPAPSQQPAPPQNEEEMKKLIIKQYMDNLIKRAESNQDPAFVAEMILNDAQLYKIPVEVIKAEMLSKEALDNLSATNTSVAAYRPWFDAVQTQMVALIADSGGA